MSVNGFFADRPLRKYVYGYFAGSILLYGSIFVVPESMKLTTCRLAMLYTLPYFIVCPVVSISLTRREGLLPQFRKLLICSWLVGYSALVFCTLLAKHYHYTGVVPAHELLIFFALAIFSHPFHIPLCAIAAKYRLL